MRQTVQRSSPGADALRVVAFILSISLPSAASAQQYADGNAAYLQRDWAAAESLWLIEAADGSAEALLGLGNLYDFGLLGEADPQRALDLYRDAARAGLSEAAFNVAVMHDMGLGTSEDPQTAAGWYAFAALGGNDRAAYNLGRFFVDGIGVGRNETLAAYWFGSVAGTLPSAQDALVETSSQSDEIGELSAPAPLFLELFSTPAGREARAAWQDQTSWVGSTYHVDVIAMGPDGGGQRLTGRTSASALSVAMPSRMGELAWRVSEVNTDRYAASAWVTAEGEPLDISPSGVVRFEFGRDDRRAEGLAYRMGGAMERFGSVVSYVPVTSAIETSSVNFGYVQDSAFASDVAAFLPGIGTAGADLLSGGDIGPEEVRIRLSFENAQP